MYKVVVEPGFFAVAGNKKETIKNRVQIYWVEKDNKIVEMQGQRWYALKDIAPKAWSRKVVGQAQTEDVTVDMTGGSVYDSNGTTTDNTQNFIAPKGSYPYQVLVNEAGDWDLSSAQLTDTLSGPMAFVGYVKVDAFHIDQEAPASSLTDQAALNYFAGKDPAETFWVKIDGKTQFAITPKTCSPNQNHAYRLTYYAQPNASGTVLVTNEFGLSGTVGYGEKTYNLAGIKASAQVTVSGDNSFAAQKHALFYEPAQVTEGNYSKGTLYWAIRVDGKSLPAGFALKDTPAAGTGITGNHIHEDSLIGVYTGETDLILSDYKTLDALKSSLIEVQSNNYTSNREDSQPLTVTFKEEITLENQSLYVLVKTEPDALPQNPRDVFTYSNGLQTSSAEGNWVDHGPAQQTLYGKATIFKELADVFTTDGQNITFSTSGKSRADYDTNLLQGKPGKYVGWLIHLNYAGTLNGTYRVEEQIPQGMEIAYIRMYWYGAKVQNETPKSAMAPINGLGADWSPKNNTSTGNNTGLLTNYYYVNGQKAIMDVTKLVPGGGYRDDYAVELQIVCKLTDPEVLLGGQEKTFNNTVTLRNLNDDVIDTAASGVTLSVPQIQKGKDNEAEVSGGNYPFTIQLNQEGVDLMPGSDTITLVDELGGNLTIDISSITVKNSKTGEDLAGSWSSSVETANGKQTLKIVLPDNQPLTISYTTAVNAAPGQTVTVENNAHWEGYATTTGGSVKDNSFQYQAGGTAGAAATPQILISKVDQYNNQQKLAGAEFKLTEMELEDGKLEETITFYTGTTDADGKLTFGEDTDLLTFNKVYRIQETKAPEGYVLDSVPRYVLIAQKVDGKYPDFTQYQGLDVTVTIHYATPQYTYTAFNHKGEIEVTKAFQNADGTPLDYRNGTYRFGLFADKEGTKLLQETYVTYAYGQLTASAKFTDVAFGKPYYVFELNDQGEPIPHGQPGTVGGVPFVVSYGSSEITVTAEAPVGNVTVTNRLNYAELPRTGGSGTAGFTALGILLIAASLTLFAVKRRREPRS